MKWKYGNGAITLLITVCLAGILVASIMAGGQEDTADRCNSAEVVSMKGSDLFGTSDQYDMQFSLDDELIYRGILMNRFAISGMTTRGPSYHCAEDYEGDPGTPVYAMADGRVAFSGKMEGYGWLVIVNHPQYDIYSLYGHLSPSRWNIGNYKKVEKGDLLGYLGDDYENGGSEKEPLIPHLHFGIRIGQRIDYPGAGDWRWMAGWIKSCPQDKGWLQPSAVVMNQGIPESIKTEKPTGYLKGWKIDFGLLAIYLIGALCAVIFAIKRNNKLLLGIYGLILLIAGVIFFQKRFIASYVLLPVSLVLIVIGVPSFLRSMQELRLKRSEKQRRK